MLLRTSTQPERNRPWPRRLDFKRKLDDVQIENEVQLPSFSKAFAASFSSSLSWVAMALDPGVETSGAAEEEKRPKQEETGS